MQDFYRNSRFYLQHATARPDSVVSELSLTISLIKAEATEIRRNIRVALCDTLYLSSQPPTYIRCIFAPLKLLIFLPTKPNQTKLSSFFKDIRKNVESLDNVVLNIYTYRLHLLNTLRHFHLKVSPVATCGVGLI